jgi:hypothetical protein
MKTETSQGSITFRKTLDEIIHSGKKISENVELLNECLQNNKSDNPSTKDIFDAVIAIRTEKLAPQTYINMMTNLVENYLKNKKINHEQSSVNLLEAALNFIQDLEGSISGLSEESKFVKKILDEILQPRERFDINQINSTKKKILKSYFENHDVTYDDFKNLLKFHQIDDLESQTDMFKSFLKRGNLDETKFVEYVNDFLQDKDKPNAENKGKILKEYLVHRNNEEVTQDKVLHLAEKIGLKIYSQETMDRGNLFKANSSTAKNQQVSNDVYINEKLQEYITSAPGAKLNDSIEKFVAAINSEIEFRNPKTDVAAKSSTKAMDRSRNDNGR